MQLPPQLRAYLFPGHGVLHKASDNGVLLFITLPHEQFWLYTYKLFLLSFKYILQFIWDAGVWEDRNNMYVIININNPFDKFLKNILSTNTRVLKVKRYKLDRSEFIREYNVIFGI